MHLDTCLSEHSPNQHILIVVSCQHSLIYRDLDLEKRVIDTPDLIFRVTTEPPTFLFLKSARGKTPALFWPGNGFSFAHTWPKLIEQ